MPKRRANSRSSSIKSKKTEKVSKVRQKAALEISTRERIIPEIDGLLMKTSQSASPHYHSYSFSLPGNELLPNSPESATLYEPFIDLTNSKLELYEKEFFGSAVGLGDFGSDENSKSFIITTQLFNDTETSMDANFMNKSFDTSKTGAELKINVIDKELEDNNIDENDIFDFSESENYNNIITSIDTNLNVICTNNDTCSDSLPTIYNKEFDYNEATNNFQSNMLDHNYNYDLAQSESNFQHYNVNIVTTPANQTLNCDATLITDNINEINNIVDFDMNSFSNFSSSNSASHLEFISTDVSDMLSDYGMSNNFNLI